MKTSFQFLFFSILSCGYALLAFAQTTPNIQIVWGDSTMTEQALAVRQIADGSLYVAGSSAIGSLGGQDMSLTKLSPTGTIIWTQYYGTNNNDYCTDMEIDNDGNILLVGYTENSPLETDGMVVKIAPNGNEIWQQRTPSSDLVETLNGIALAPDGGIVVGGFRTDNYASNDCYVVKFDSNGVFLWQQSYGGSGNDVIYKIRATPDGGYVFSADSDSFGRNSIDIYVVKLDGEGNMEWNLLVGDDDYANGCKTIMVTSSGDYLIAGESIVDNSFLFDATLLKVSAQGEVMWLKQWGGNNSTEAGFGLLELADGSFLVSGYSNDPNNSEPIDGMLLHIDSLGNELGVEYWGTNEVDLLYDLIAAQDGGYWLAGFQNLLGNGQYWLLHYDLSIGLDSPPNAALINIAQHNRYLNISCPNNVETLEIELYDTQGRLLDNRPSLRQLQGGQYVCDLTNIPTGLLVVRLHADGSYFSRLIVLK